MSTRPAKILPNRRGILVLAGSIVLMVVLGSVHGFSVFLEPAEVRFGAGRADISLTYSLALAAITVLVLAGHHVYRRFSPPLLVVVAAALAVTGTLVAGFAGTIATVWLGYGLLFGAANGIGYGFCLQFAAQANPGHRGLAMGIVTAAYGLGATVSPLPLNAVMDVYGFRGGMIGLAVAIASAGPIVAALFARSGIELKTESGLEGSVGDAPRSEVLRWWSSYGLAVAAGLMAIGHATGIARVARVADAWVVVAPVALGAANVIGSYAGGDLVDRWGARRLLASVAALSAIALAGMSLSPTPVVTLTGLGAVGFAYGATIAAYPVAIASAYGSVAAIRVYGKVFTAWGTVGLVAPWLAGVIFERDQGYGQALQLAAILAAASLISLIWMPRRMAYARSDESA